MPLLGELALFPFASMPLNWAPCDGTVQTITSNQRLFSLLGTTFGGDGLKTFALPDLRSSAPTNGTYAICVTGTFPSKTGTADGFTGEVRLFAFNFVPGGWAACDGSILPIRGNAPLFSLIGNTFGGDKTVNFALPDYEKLSPAHCTYCICIGGTFPVHP